MQAASRKEANRRSQSSLMGGQVAGASDCPVLLNEAFERIAVTCVPQFEKIAGEGMTVSWCLASLTNETAAAVVASIDPAAITAHFDVPALGSRLLVSLDYEFVQLVIELMCGGLCGEPLSRTPRPGTSIDRQFARIALALLASTIERECLAFDLGGVTLGQIETKLDPAILGKRAARIVVATLVMECQGHRGGLRVALPQVVADRFKQESLPAHAEIAASDPVWTEHFQAEIGRTVVRLDAFLNADSLTLGEVAELAVGQVIPLPETALSRCELRNDGKLLFRCEVGQGDARYSLRVDEIAPGEEAKVIQSPLSFLTPF